MCVHGGRGGRREERRREGVRGEGRREKGRMGEREGKGRRRRKIVFAIHQYKGHNSLWTVRHMY